MKKRRLIALVVVFLFLLSAAGGCGIAPASTNPAGNAAVPQEQAGQSASLDQPALSASSGAPAESAAKNSPEKPPANSAPPPAAASSPTVQGASSSGAQAPAALPAVNGPTINTTLNDGALQNGNKKTFDVWAKDKNGKKISPTDLTVILNGQTVPVTWDDSEKTSYTLTFSKSGSNIVEIETGALKKTYTLNYQPAQEGETIGQMVLSIEAFTIGGGYLLDPVYVDIKEGENGAQLLDRVLKAQGYAYEKTGSLTANFYLVALRGGALPVKAQVPDFLKAKLLSSGFKDLNEQDNVNDGGLGEFDYTHGSGWMYCINTKFPNVGLADYYPTDGDVMRLQFTLAYGADIGGRAAGNYYSVADKDRLTALIAQKGYAKIPENVRATVKKLNASQAEVDQAIKTLQAGAA